jgi:hypothetical protein
MKKFTKDQNATILKALEKEVNFCQLQMLGCKQTNLKALTDIWQSDITTLNKMIDIIKAESLNNTVIVCKWEKGFLDIVDIDLDLTIVPNVGDIYLHFDNGSYTELVVKRRQIVKHLSSTAFVITFIKN